jgi:peptidoglycan/xylan/chitin deacetylase (PgdA/CDA1 family)
MLAANKFACLTYHVIGDEASQYTLSERQLRAQLTLLKAEAYLVEGFQELETRLRSGMAVAPRYIVFTIDDGHESSMRVADLLQEHGFKATFFLTRERCLKKPGFVREPDIRALRERGFSLGTHGVTHRGLTFHSEQRCIAELAGSKQWLEDVLGEKVSYLSAPGGFINSRVMNLAYGHGYTLLGTSNEWMNSLETMALPCAVNRVNVRRHFSLKTFRHILEGHLGFYAWRQVRALSLWIPRQLLYPRPTEQSVLPS